MVFIIYRFSSKRMKTRLEDFTKEECLLNFKKVFGFTNFTLIADNCIFLDNYFKSFGIISIERTTLGNSGSLRHGFELVYSLEGRGLLKVTDVVYFVEDDFIHHPDASRELLEEGLKEVDYVSLYDHADKYVEGAGNPGVTKLGEDTKVFLTKHTHWKLTNSTVQTFACKVSTLKEDKDIFYKYNFRGNSPDSFSTFRDLRLKGRNLATPIPGKATHCHSPWESPLIDWKAIIREVSK